MSARSRPSSFPCRFLPGVVAGVWIPALLGCDPGSVDGEHPVRATLSDGQVLLGAVQTETLTLRTGFGEVAVPLVDVGEVRPVEGGALAGSGNHVGVWLRNGSELRGEWAEPELRMELLVARQAVGVDLPMDQLERFQLQGGDLMPEGSVVRVRTVYGDDFLVDPDQSWITLDNELGRFSPTLAEVTSLAPTESQLAGPDGRSEWSLALDTGTVLIGELGGAGVDDEALAFVLPLGPSEVLVPVADVVSVQRQDWGGYWVDQDQGGGVRAPAAAEQAGQRDSGIWFDNQRQSGFKARH